MQRFERQFAFGGERAEGEAYFVSGIATKTKCEAPFKASDPRQSRQAQNKRGLMSSFIFIFVNVRMLFFSLDITKSLMIYYECIRFGVFVYEN